MWDEQLLLKMVVGIGASMFPYLLATNPHFEARLPTRGMIGNERRQWLLAKIRERTTHN